MCTILGNLLENAIEACDRLPNTQKRTISISTHETEHLWFLMIKNRYDGVLLKKQHHFLSRKENGKRIGIGIKSVNEIVLRHNGTIDIYTKYNFSQLVLHYHLQIHKIIML